MSERAVKAYLQTLLDGLAVETVAQPLAVFVQFDSEYTPTAPTLWLWADRWDEKRLAGSPGAGLKEITYQLVCPLLWDVDPSQSDESQVDDLVNAIVRALRPAGVTTVQVSLSDPITGETSSLRNVGEQISVRRVPPAALAEQGLIRYAVALGFTLAEEVFA